jgi:hypothetical protein
MPRPALVNRLEPALQGDKGYQLHALFARPIQGPCLDRGFGFQPNGQTSCRTRFQRPVSDFRNARIIWIVSGRATDVEPISIKVLWTKLRRFPKKIAS